MHRRVHRLRALPKLLLVVTALLALGQIQSVPAAVPTAHELVAGPVTSTSMAAARLVRHVPTPAPFQPLPVVAWAAAALLLLVRGVPSGVSSVSPRTRQAYLLPLAGRGPPSRS